MTTPKRHLVDPTLAATLLDYCPSRLIQDPNDFGFLFESLATRDARVFAAAIDTSRFHYRERAGTLEVDLIVQRTNGTSMAIEFELGGAH
jgi:hypothetical protein